MMQDATNRSHQIKGLASALPLFDDGLKRANYFVENALSKAFIKRSVTCNHRKNREPAKLDLTNQLQIAETPLNPAASLSHRLFA